MPSWTPALTHVYLLECSNDLPNYRKAAELLAEALTPHLERMGYVPRICHKMATGTGKTTVMAMLILYYASNHAANPDDPRFVNQFLVISPNTTVRDRLRPSLRPNEDEQHDDYAERNLLPHPRETYRDYLKQAHIAVINWHQAQPKNIGETIGGAGLNVIRGQTPDAAPNSMESQLDAILRAADTSPNGGNIVVINDEAHHCHYGDPGKPPEPTKWLEAIMALHAGNLLQGSVIDMSATPFFLQANKNPLFPWIVSDCGLIEAQEAGLTKIPRAPVSRDAGRAAEFRSIYEHTPPERRGRNFDPANDDNCHLLKEALNLAAEDYTQQTTPEWMQSHAGDERSATMPALAIVADKVQNANALYRYVAEGSIDCTPVNDTDGNPFSNFQPNTEGKEWREGPPRTIVIHSEIDNSDFKTSNREMKAHFKRLADRYRRFYDAKLGPELNDEEIIRAVMNSVGKPGEPGEHVRCVISVGMLTEGWDAKNVTHLVGFRPFKSSLLCEQVAGRTLRRSVWDPDEAGLLSPEYSCVLGIPFREKPETGTKPPPNPMQILTVATPDDRIQFAIGWPNITRLDRVENDLSVRAMVKRVTASERFQTMEHQGQGIHVEPTIGTGQAIPSNPPNTEHRFAYEVAGQATQNALTDLERGDVATAQVRVNVLFADMLSAFEQHRKDGNLLPPTDTARWPSDPGSIADAANWLNRHTELVVPTPPDGKPPMTAVKGKAHWLDTTLRHEYSIRDNPNLVYANCRKSHATHAKCDSSWETAVAKILDDMPEVTRWARNNRLGWEIPYVYEGQAHAYQPDFVAVAELPEGSELHLVIEVKGREKESDRVKRRWTEAYWTTAVNADAEYGDKKAWKYLYLDEQGMASPRENIENAIEEARNAAA